MQFRVSQLDWPRILVTRTAAALLGISAALSVCALAIMHSDTNLNALSSLKRDVPSIIGAASAFGFISLIICMAFFWLRCDSSSRSWRTIWFLVLLFGSLYGSAVPYYAFVYLPAVFRQLRNPGDESSDASSAKPDVDQRRIGPFHRILLFGWGFFLIPVIAILVFTRISSKLTEIIAIAFFLGSAIVISESVFHAILSLYRSGMSRPPKDGDQRH